jgi:predicted dehydrogenase
MEYLKNSLAPLKALGVVMVDSIDTLLGKVDVVLLLSIDGRTHLEQVRPVFAAGKRVFIDKPVGGSLVDAIKIYELAKQCKVPCFSSSCLRFSPHTVAVRNDPKIGEIRGCDAFSPCPFESHHPDLYWYGIHGVETLFTIMGPGCKSVVRLHAAQSDVVVGLWNDNRIGSFRGTREGPHSYGATAFGTKGIANDVGKFEGYEPLIVEIAKFFKTGKPPVSAEQTLEIMAFMEAADESKRQGGVPVAIESVLAKAKTTAMQQQ